MAQSEMGNHSEPSGQSSKDEDIPLRVCRLLQKSFVAGPRGPRFFVAHCEFALPVA